MKHCQMHQFNSFCTEFRVTKYCQIHPNTTRRTKTWDYGPMGWIGSVHCEKLRWDFMARTFKLIAPVQPILYRVSCSNETLPNAPYTTECSKTWVWGPVGWIGCVRCEKFRCDFVARTFVLSAPVHPVLHQTSCSSETIQNAPKHYETHQKMSLGSYRMKQVH